MGKIDMVREIVKYQATDGTEFNTEEEAKMYQELLRNPQFKKMQERIDKLEQDLMTVKVEIATLHREPATKPIWPQPGPMYSYQAYNPATGGKL